MRFSIFNLVLVYLFSLLGLVTGQYILASYLRFDLTSRILTLAGYSIHSYTTDKSNTLEDVTINTPAHKVTLRTEFSLTFRISNQNPEYKLHLEPNHDIFVQAPHIRHLDASGEIRHTETLDGTQHRVFKGAVWARFGDHDWQKKGWARVYVLQDGENPIFEGAFTISGQRYRVEAISEEENGVMEERLSHMVVHHDARRGANGVGETCAAGRMPSNLGTSDILMDSIGMITGSTGLDKRQFGGFNPGDLTDSIGSAEGCPTTRRVALVGIATDCSYTAAFNSTESVRRNLINMVNTASEVFESTFNISLGLHNVTISDASCPDSASDSTPWNVECSEGDMDWRLRQFSSWRRSLDDSTNAYWTLMTTCRTGGEVGVSWIGQLCNSRMSTNVVARTSNEWQVFA
ncbi:hypothetical protein N8T08_004106 [Aspergillus melleus]|uniref:Uncharacterized protein n=1 Tax=Aspergillus melleus TaxID=138277 RepID=A0ACC3B5Q2_9EURO|nr:hypothetical protein N8T08_004106 [Aspergillus melleus]